MFSPTTGISNRKAFGRCFGIREWLVRFGCLSPIAKNKKDHENSAAEQHDRTPEAVPPQPESSALRGIPPTAVLPELDYKPLVALNWEENHQKPDQCDPEAATFNRNSMGPRLFPAMCRPPITPLS